jgi:hypothetical protein
MFLARSCELTHQSVRAWEERFAPVFTETLKAKRKGKAGKKWKGIFWIASSFLSNRGKPSAPGECLLRLDM